MLKGKSMNLNELIKNKPEFCLYSLTTIMLQHTNIDNKNRMIKLNQFLETLDNDYIKSDQYLSKLFTVLDMFKSYEKELIKSLQNNDQLITMLLQKKYNLQTEKKIIRNNDIIDNSNCHLNKLEVSSKWWEK